MKSGGYEGSRIAAMIVVALASAGCGEELPPEPPEPPQIGAVNIGCDAAPMDNEAVDVDEVVTTLSVEVFDEDRDLLEVVAQLDGVALVGLQDDDADDIYEWTAPESLDPVACRGVFGVVVRAADLAGNVVEQHVEVEAP